MTAPPPFDLDAAVLELLRWLQAHPEGRLVWCPSDGWAVASPPDDLPDELLDNHLLLVLTFGAALGAQLLERVITPNDPPGIYTWRLGYAGRIRLATLDHLIRG